MSLILPIFFIGIHMVSSATPKYYISGTGCGLVNAWKNVDTLPQDLEALKSLQCVFTNDREGYQRWQQTQKSWKWASEWSECSKICGDGGEMVRMRECKNGTHTLDLSECNLDSNNVTMKCSYSTCPPCILFDTYYQGADEIETLTGITNIYLCHGSCQNNVDCEYWSFNQLDLTCQLLRTEGTEMDYNNNILSGPKNCDPNEVQTCFNHHTSIIGNEVKVQKTGNIITCQHICEDDNQCQFWTYLYDQERCKLHSSIDGGLDEDNSVAITAPKDCQPLHFHESKNMYINKIKFT